MTMSAPSMTYNPEGSGALGFDHLQPIIDREEIIHHATDYPLESTLLHTAPRARALQGLIDNVAKPWTEATLRAWRNPTMLKALIQGGINRIGREYTQAQQEFLIQFCGEGSAFEGVQGGVLELDLSNPEDVARLFGGADRAEALKANFMAIAPEYIKTAPVGAALVTRNINGWTFDDIASGELFEEPNETWTQEVENLEESFSEGDTKIVVFDTKTSGTRTAPYIYGEGLEEDIDRFIEAYRPDGDISGQWNDVSPPRRVLELPEGFSIKDTSRASEGARRHLVYNQSADRWYLMDANVLAEDFTYIQAASAHYYVTELMRDVDDLTHIGQEIHQQYCERYPEAGTADLDDQEKEAALGLTNISAADTAATLRYDSVNQISQDSGLYIHNLQEIVDGKLSAQDVLWFAQISHGGWAAAKRFQGNIDMEDAGFFTLTPEQIEQSLFSIQMGALQILKRLKQDHGREIQVIPHNSSIVHDACNLVAMDTEATDGPVALSRDLMASPEMKQAVLKALGKETDENDPIGYAAVTGVQLGIIRIAQYYGKQRPDYHQSPAMTENDYLQALWCVANFDQLDDNLKLHVGKLMHFTWQATQAPRDINRVARGINASFSSGVMTKQDVLQLDYDQVNEKMSAIAQAMREQGKFSALLDKAEIR